VDAQAETQLTCFIITSSATILALSLFTPTSIVISAYILDFASILIAMC